MTLFEAVKQSVTTRQAAEYYHFRVGRSGFISCPFHNDRTPSMKVDNRFHCFGCGADGDVIDFVARLNNLNQNHRLSRWYALRLQGECTSRVSRRIELSFIRIECPTTR